MPRNTTPSHRSSHLTRSGVVAAVVAATFIAIAILSAGVIMAANGNSGFPFLPRAKATVMGKEVSAAATAAALHPTKPTITPNNGQTTGTAPTPTLSSGIFSMSQGPFPNTEFSVDTFYRGWVGTQWVYVYAGTAWTTYPTVGKGAIKVYDANMDLIGTYFAPDGSSVVSIKSANGSILTLVSDKSPSLTFNLANHTFGS